MKLRICLIFCGFLFYLLALAVDPRNSVFSVIALTGPPSMETKDGYEDAANRKAVVAVFNPEDPTPIAAWSIREVRRLRYLYHSEAPHCD